MTADNIPPMIVTDTGITIFMNGEVLVAPSDHPNYMAIKDAIARYDFDIIPELLEIRKNVETFVASVAADDFTMHGDLLCLSGKPFTFEVTSKVLDMIAAGAPAQPIYNFLHKVRQNPRVAAQDELLLFCVANNFMIHEDGDIIAYKSVRGDYTDIHSGKFSNHVGAVVEMDRQNVDDDRNRTCSTGLHFASYEYASTWAGTIDGVNRRLMVMKINPADVVAIPSDYNNQKGRCSRYTVVSEITAQGASLPRREVYTDDDLGVTRSTDVAECVTAERDRKQAIHDRWCDELAETVLERDRLTAEIDDLEYRARQIEDLGGDAYGLWEEIDGLTTGVDQLESKVTTLTNKIDRIQSEIEAL